MTDPLRANPHRVGWALIGDLAGLYSARRGDYRIIYTIDEETIVGEVADVRRRSDVYRRR